MSYPSTASTVPGSLPLIGHLVPLIRRPFDFMRSLPRHGDVVRLRLGTASVFVVCDPDLTREVLRDDQVYDKGGVLIDRLRETLGDGLVTCPHSMHRQQRRLLQPAFHRSLFPGYMDILANQTVAVLDSWRDGDVVDIVPNMMAIMARTSAATMFSDTLATSTLRQTADDVAAIFSAWYRRMVTPPPLDRLPTSTNRAYHQARDRLRRTITEAIAERRASGTDRADLLAALLAARDAEGDGRRLTDAELMDQAMTFLLAGIEPVSHPLAWSLHMVAGHPGVQQRLQAEVDTVLGGRPAAYGDLYRLQVADRVWTETLRLWAPGWFSTRVTTTATELGGHPIPAGATVIFSPHIIHHRPDLYPDPDRFDPDRWLPERAATIPANSYLPFGGGPRICIGNQLGSTEAVLCLATITSRWHLEPVPGRVRPALSSAVTPRGLRLRVTARQRPDQGQV